MRTGGFDQMTSKRVSDSCEAANASSALSARTPLAPLDWALRCVRSTAREFTSTAHTAALGDSNDMIVAIGPHPQPRSRNVPSLGRSGAISRS